MPIDGHGVASFSIWGISGMAILHVPRRLPKKRPWRLPSSAQREGRRPKPTPRLIINALLLPIYRWRPFPRPSLVPPVEPEKSRAARAGLLHARNPHASFVPTKFKKGRAWALADHFVLPAITGLHGLRMRKQLGAGQDASSRCDKRRDCWRTAGERTRVRTHKLNEKLG